MSDYVWIASYSDGRASVCAKLGTADEHVLYGPLYNPLALERCKVWAYENGYGTGLAIIDKKE